MKPQLAEVRDASPIAPIALEPVPKANTLPFVTVVVPCRNEEKHIGRCLESILATNYPKERMEILVLDGMSEDRTREIVAGFSERHPIVRLVGNPEKHIPAAMNLGIQTARGETIIKMDAHSTFQREHISLCVAYQEKYGAENVGGICKMTPGADTATARAIVLGLSSRFGSGNANVKVGVAKPTWSDTAAFGCFKKELFSRVGLFDERLLSSSDLDMNLRIRAAGGGILVVPDVIIRYVADANMRAFCRHVFADGVWISYVMKFGKKAWSWRHWVPAAFVAGLAGALALSAVNRALLWLGLGVAGTYAVVSLAVSLQIAAREREARYAFLLPAVFAARHFVHGIGTLFGLLLVAMPGEHWKNRRGMKA
jgi:glycosyltransferase involved in cell wall biosynthesis